MAKKVSSAKFCENVAQMLEEVKGCGEAVTITERSHPVAVLISFESFKALQERLRDLEEAQLWQIVAQGRKEHRQGCTRRIKSLRAASSLYANCVDEAFRKGKLRGLWAFSVTRDIRIIFEFLNGDEVLFHDIGSHHRVY
jgi:prevent-host-death family protein